MQIFNNFIIITEFFTKKTKSIKLNFYNLENFKKIINC